MSFTEANMSPFLIPTTVPSVEFSSFPYHPWLYVAILSVLAIVTFIFRAPRDGGWTPDAATPDQVERAEEREGCSDDDAGC